MTKDVPHNSLRRNSRGNAGRRCRSGTGPRVRGRVWRSETENVERYFKFIEKFVL